MRFKISGTNYQLANTIRRTMISAVECFAIDSVTMYENSSAIFDEYIAHRVGLVPLKTPSDYTEKDEVMFSLNVEGPATAYSKDLKSNDNAVVVANGNIPIIKLAEGQKVRLEGKAILRSSSARSSKFQPGLITYKPLNDTDFEFYIETFGQMTPMEILNRALSIINSHLKEVYKELKK
ncbi:MAG: DNA-directed RNA polymerase subunit D [Candidatus Micrarchaeota archaeon]|nr:DNA-directed RNA polymerase subunit D [Candidatus Micrarchaeota archaeon]